MNRVLPDYKNAKLLVYIGKFAYHCMINKESHEN